MIIERNNIMNSLKETLLRLPTVTLVVGLLFIIGITVYVTWRIAMRHSYDNYIVRMWGRSYKTLNNKSKKADDITYLKIMDMKYEEIAIWRELYKIYGSNLLTFGFAHIGSGRNPFCPNLLKGSEKEKTILIKEPFLDDGDRALEVEIINDKEQIEVHHYLAHVSEPNIVVKRADTTERILE